MKSKIVDTITTGVQNKTFEIYAKAHHMIASRAFEDMAFDRKKAEEEIEKQVDCATAAFNCIWDILLTKNYIKCGEDGKYTIVDAANDVADSVKANDILLTADASFVSACSNMRTFLAEIDTCAIPAMEYHSRRSTLAGICLLLNSLIDEASELSDYPSNSQK